MQDCEHDPVSLQLILMECHQNLQAGKVWVSWNYLFIEEENGVMWHWLGSDVARKLLLEVGKMVVQYAEESSCQTLSSGEQGGRHAYSSTTPREEATKQSVSNMWWFGKNWLTCQQKWKRIESKYVRLCMGEKLTTSRLQTLRNGNLKKQQQSWITNI